MIIHQPFKFQLYAGVLRYLSSTAKEYQRLLSSSSRSKTSYPHGLEGGPIGTVVYTFDWDHDSFISLATIGPNFNENFDNKGGRRCISKIVRVRMVQGEPDVQSGRLIAYGPWSDGDWVSLYREWCATLVWKVPPAFEMCNDNLRRSRLDLKFRTTSSPWCPTSSAIVDRRHIHSLTCPNIATSAGLTSTLFLCVSFLSIHFVNLSYQFLQDSSFHREELYVSTLEQWVNPP